MDKILILDNGSQYTQLIGRRVRELGVYSEIVPGDADISAQGPYPEALRDCVGIILSGSPYSAYEKDAPAIHASVMAAGLPVLGICYGIQRMMYDAGGRVETLHEREYGRKLVRLVGASDTRGAAALSDGRAVSGHKASLCAASAAPAADIAGGAQAAADIAGSAQAAVDPLFAGIPDEFVSWMSHGDSIAQPAPGWDVLALSEGGIPAALVLRGRRCWGLQFHPEVSHCEHGMTFLANFVRGICGARQGWSMQAYLDDEANRIRARAKDRDVLLLISGGVDSTVAGAFLLKILKPDRVHLLYIDTGLMRKAESDEVMNNLRKLGARHLYMVNAEERFLSALAGVEEPEKKRAIIGDLFIRVQEDEVARLGIPQALLVQGTLYTDLIESGKGIGGKAQLIKSHHNVRSPLIEAKRAAGLVIEPLDRLYKDEVRALGRLLGLPERIVGRHPFPGPGLGVRVLGEVTREKCDILREADAIFIDELRERGLYDKIWQAFCVLLPIRSVGVAGDERTYGYVLALRAITSEDGMTAGVFSFAMPDLLAISAAITNRVPQIGRVAYDISSKPPATIEWE